MEKIKNNSEARSDKARGWRTKEKGRREGKRGRGKKKGRKEGKEEFERGRRTGRDT